MTGPLVKWLNAHHRAVSSSSGEEVVCLMGQYCPVRLLKVCHGLPFNIIIIHY
jgi:hypothetical protein